MRKLSSALAWALWLPIFTVHPTASPPKPSPSPSRIAEAHAGPHGGEVLQEGKYQFEVKVNRKTSEVSVFTLKRGPEVPQDMSITLFTNPDTSRKIALRAINPQGPLPLYQGQLSMGAENFIGLELRFDTQSTGPQVIKAGKAP